MILMIISFPTVVADAWSGYARLGTGTEEFAKHYGQGASRRFDINTYGMHGAKVLASK